MTRWQLERLITVKEFMELGGIPTVGAAIAHKVLAELIKEAEREHIREDQYHDRPPNMELH